MKRWRADPTEENFWGVVLAYAGVKFKTYSGLPFSYQIKKGRSGEYTKELWIDRREKSKSLAWSSVLLALKNINRSRDNNTYVISKETEIGMLVETYQKLDTNAQKRLIGYLEALKELS